LSGYYDYEEEEIIEKVEDWENDEYLKCKICGTTATKHPRVRGVKGCPKCKFATKNLSKNFDRK